MQAFLAQFQELSLIPITNQMDLGINLVHEVPLTDYDYCKLFTKDSAYANKIGSCLIIEDVFWITLIILILLPNLLQHFIKKWEKYFNSFPFSVLTSIEAILRILIEGSWNHRPNDINPVHLLWKPKNASTSFIRLSPPFWSILKAIPSNDIIITVVHVLRVNFVNVIGIYFITGLLHIRNCWEAECQLPGRNL